ncbi:hypothetical protein SprV_0100376200 [Sparganum proliferum]
MGYYTRPFLFSNTYANITECCKDVINDSYLEQLARKGLQDVEKSQTVTKRKQDVKRLLKTDVDFQRLCHLRLSNCIKLIRRNKVIEENFAGSFLRTYLKSCWKRNIHKKVYNPSSTSDYVAPRVRTTTRTKRSARQHSLADALRTETLHLAPLFIKPVSSLVLSAQNILPMNDSAFSPFDILQYHFRVLNVDVGVIERFSSEFFPNASRLDTWVETNEFSGREVDSGHVRYTGNIVQSPEPSAKVTERILLHAVDTDLRRQATLILRINFIRIDLKVVASGPLFVFRQPKNTLHASILERLETNMTGFSAGWEDPVVAVLQMTQLIVPLTGIHQQPKLHNVFSDNSIYEVRRKPTRGSLRIILGQFIVDNISKYTQEDVRLKRVIRSDNGHEVSRLPCSLYYESPDSSECPKTKYSSSDTPFLDQVFEIDHQPECGKIISKRLAQSVTMFSLKTLQQDDIFFVDNGNETCNFAKFEHDSSSPGELSSTGCLGKLIRSRSVIIPRLTADKSFGSFFRGNQINYLVSETLNGFLSKECDNKIPISSFTETEIRRNRVCFHHTSTTGSTSAGFRFQLQQAGIRSRTWDMPIRVRRITNVSVVARPLAVALHVPTEITVENLHVIMKESTQETETLIHSHLHPRSEFCHQPDYEIRFTVIKIPHYCAVWKALHNGLLGHALEDSRSVLVTNFTQCNVFDRQLWIICSASMAMPGNDKFSRPSEELQLRVTVFVPAPPEKKEAVLTEREVKLPILIYQQSKTDQTEILPVARVHFAQRTHIDTFAVALFDKAMRPYKVSRNATINIRVLPVYGTITCGKKSVRLGEGACKVFDYTHRGLPSTGDFVEFDITDSTSPKKYDSGIILPIVVQFPVKSRKTSTDSVGQRTIVNEQIHHRLNEESFTLNTSHFFLPHDLQNHEVFFEVDEVPLQVIMAYFLLRRWRRSLRQQGATTYNQMAFTGQSTNNPAPRNRTKFCRRTRPRIRVNEAVERITKADEIILRPVHGCTPISMASSSVSPEQVEGASFYVVSLPANMSSCTLVTSSPSILNKDGISPIPFTRSVHGSPRGDAAMVALPGDGGDSPIWNRQSVAGVSKLMFIDFIQKKEKEDTHICLIGSPSDAFGTTGSCEQCQKRTDLPDRKPEVMVCERCNI